MPIHEETIDLMNENAKLRLQLEEARKTLRATARFAMWSLMEGSWQGADIDGSAAQDKAVELGLIVSTAYDPEKHGDSDCCKPGDEWFVPSETLLDALKDTQS